jgi:hypothetical protein
MKNFFSVLFLRTFFKKTNKSLPSCAIMIMKYYFLLEVRKRMNILQYLKNHILYLDGGMGTLLQERGLVPGEMPERWNLTNPDAIVAIDALAARSCDRLAATVQLSNAGISPGSGIGNDRCALSRQTLGIPVIALGIPTVVDSSTLVYDALRQAGIDDVDERLRQILENGRRFYVSPKESDLITARTALLVAHAINRALVGVEALH